MGNPGASFPMISRAYPGCAHFQPVEGWYFRDTAVARAVSYGTSWIPCVDLDRLYFESRPSKARVRIGARSPAMRADMPA